MKLKNRSNSPHMLRNGNMEKVRIGARAVFEVVDTAEDADNLTKFFFNDRQKLDLDRSPIFDRLKDDAEVTPVDSHIETLLGSSVLPSMIELAEGNEVPLGAVVIRAHKESELSIADWNALEADDREERLAEMVETMKAEVAPADADEDAEDADENSDEGENLEDLSIEELKALYAEKAGKNAGRKWKEARLISEIRALEE